MLTYNSSSRVFRSAVCVVSLLACASFAYGQTANLTLSPGSGAKGSTVSLPLAYTSNGAQLSGIQWSFSYSSADFSGVSVDLGPAASGAGKTISCNASGAGRYICIASGLNANAVSNGTLATANFTISNSTTATSSAVQVASASAASGAAQPMSVTGSGATVSITNPTSTASLNSLSCNPTSVTSPGSSQCTVTLTGAAPSGGAAVTLGWSSTGATVTMPASLTIPAGATSGSFSVQLSASASTSVQISASLNSVTKAATINVAPAASVAVSVSPSNVTLGPGGTQQFTASVSGASNTSVSWSLSSAVGTISSTGLYTAPASVSIQQTVTVRATSTADNTKYATANVVVNPPSAPPPPSTAASFWPATAKPATVSANDRKAFEVGLRFSSSVAGSVTGVRFYKGSSNTGTHVGHLWSGNGTLLASVTFTNETASGWQQANFSTPVNISANTTYVISYFGPKGYYSVNQYYGWSSLSAAPLSVSGTSPGVYAYSSSAKFPSSTFKSSNYWVDVVFSPASTPAPTVAVAVSPSNVNLAPGGTQQFTASVTGASNTSVTWSLSSSTGTISSSGLYTAPSSVSTQQTVTVRATSAADTTKYATATVVVNPPSAPPPVSSVSFWPSTAAPQMASDPESASVELGLRFSSSTAGSVKGIRFYKGPNNTGTHVGHLWSATGALLASVTFTNETASGWQQVNFSTPVSIAANTVYIISYLAPNGYYPCDENFAWSNVNATPLSVSGSSPGVYAYGSGNTAPTNTWNNSNYWVDVVFAPAQ